MIAVIALCALLACTESSVGAPGTSLVGIEVPYVSYTYDFWGQPVAAPQAYLPSRLISGDDLGVGPLNDPGDLFVADDGGIFLVDTGNNRIICMDSQWNVDFVISKFSADGRSDQLSAPRGIYVTEDGMIYVADTGNARLVVFDRAGNLVRTIGAPTSDVEGVLPDNFRYQPIKVGVDRSGWTYVVSENLYEGFVTLDVDGVFRGFSGAPRVKPSAADLFWSRFATDAQRERMAIFLPTEYSNFDIDDKGFLYATVDAGGDSNAGQPLRRLNGRGDDLLKRTGFHNPIGDVKYEGTWSLAAIRGPSTFVDVVAQDNGVYSALDSKRGRIFTYDTNGNLLYVFGYRGTGKGQLLRPVAIDHVGNTILVLDADQRSVVVYEPTEYAMAILSALGSFQEGYYVEAEQRWRQVLSLNSNYDLAYSGIGRALLQRNEYSEAMRYFRLGNNRAQYSRAFRLYRREVLDQKFGIVMGTVCVLVALIFLLPRLAAWWRRARRAGNEAAMPGSSASYLGRFPALCRTLDSLRYSFFVIFHPFDGFYALKRERKGTLPAALTILALVTLTFVMIRQYTGFIFNPRDLTRLSIPIEAGSILVPFGLWCGANWALTTLMDGKGTIKDIVIASAFALVPFVLISVPMTVVSNFLTQEEGAFYHLVMSFGVGWSAVLMFFGAVMTLHEYTLTKALLASVATIGGMIFTVFLGFLFVNLTEQVVLFVGEIVGELTFRV